MFASLRSSWLVRRINPLLRLLAIITGTRCMSFLFKVLVLLLLSVIAGVVYVARLAVRYIGADILNVAWRLLRQGSVD